MNREFGYNSTSDGDIFVMNDETKQKISQSMMGNTNAMNHPNKRKIYCEELDTIYEFVQECNR